MPNAADVELGATEDAIVANVTIRPGLGLVAGLSVEPRLLPDQLWPQLFQVAWVVRDDRGRAPASTWAPRSASTAASHRPWATARRSSSTVARRAGPSATNGAIGAAWLVLDSFVDGNTVTP